jgi:hypothetical protein
MDISIEVVAPSAAAACQVRSQVFGHEWHVTLPDLSQYPPERQLTLVAFDRSSHDGAKHEPVAVVTVLETTGQEELHRRFGLSHFNHERAARYTQLAVLKPYRGLDLPVRLILEAHRSFVGPMEIRFTWMLFDAERAKSSSLCTLLGFRASSRQFLTEYGCSRALTRDERTARARSCDRLAQSWVDEVGHGSLAKCIAFGTREARW